VAAHQHHPARRRHPHHDPRPGRRRQHRPPRRRLLCRELVAAQRGAKPLLAAIGDYEAQMVPYGFARVADSLAQNGSSGTGPLHKPVLGRVVLAATRTYFRAVGHIPAVRRKFLDGLYTYRSS
jgi:hypothetical protein